MSSATYERTWLSTLVAFALLLGLVLALVAGTSSNASSRLVELGDRMWPGYAAELRADPVPPDCSLDELDAQLRTCSDAPAAPAPAADPFAEPVAADPFAAPTAAADPFGEPVAAAGPSCAAVSALRDRCASRHIAYDDALERITPAVRRYRALEGVVADLGRFPWWRHLLVSIVVLGGLTTTRRGLHIALREPTTRLEAQVSQGAQLAGALFIAASCWFDLQVQRGSDAPWEELSLPVLWGVGFVGMAAVNVWNLVRPVRELPTGKSSLMRLLAVVPLATWMSLIAAAWFLGIEQHFSGQAIYLHKFAQIASVYIGVGLYIWAGMLFARTRMAALLMDVLTPLGLPPALLAWLVVVLSALPTAYSGASGIFVIAAGATIFERLRAAGASPRLAVMSTAMAGSLGVVLRPCLVVVVISFLNNNVTSADLFDNGLKVFALTATLFGIAMLAYNREPLRLRPLGQALPEMGRAIRLLVPYFAVLGAVVFGFWWVLGASLNEQNAPNILPVALLALVFFDQRGQGAGPLAAVRDASEEASHHLGALFGLMVCSVGLGGVVERADVMSLVPDSLGSPFTAMMVLVVVMVLVGMTLDALGAVVLVSVTVARIADQNGIDPVHFWMMVLVAFELGYLTPPVAINHLLTRQVVGAAARIEELDDDVGTLERYEHVWIPMAVMGTALLLVAFVPLWFYP